MEKIPLLVTCLIRLHNFCIDAEEEILRSKETNCDEDNEETDITQIEEITNDDLFYLNATVEINNNRRRRASKKNV